MHNEVAAVCIANDSWQPGKLGVSLYCLVNIICWTQIFYKNKDYLSYCYLLILGNYLHLRVILLFSSSLSLGLITSIEEWRTGPIWGLLLLVTMPTTYTYLYCLFWKHYSRLSEQYYFAKISFSCTLYNRNKMFCYLCWCLNINLPLVCKYFFPMVKLKSNKLESS